MIDNDHVNYIFRQRSSERYTTRTVSESECHVVTCVVDNSNGTVRLDDAVVAFNDAIVSALPLRFDVAGV